jgi:hypothetical protein
VAAIGRKAADGRIVFNCAGALISRKHVITGQM